MDGSAEIRILDRSVHKESKRHTDNDEADINLDIGAVAWLLREVMDQVV